MKISFSICAFLVLAAVLSGCAAVGRQSRQPRASEGEQPGIPQDLAELITYAGLAPSSHNTQPWKIKILSDSEFIVQADPSRRLPEVDPEGRELLLSLGAFWENLEQAVAAFGFNAQVNILAASPKETDILRVKLIKKESSSIDIALDMMRKRVTDRRPYKKADLSPDDLEEFKALLPDHFFYFPKAGKEGKWIAESLVEANKKQAFNDAKQNELAQWLRFSSSEAKAKGDGLTAEALGLSTIEGFFWHTFMGKESALSPSFRETGVRNVVKQVNNCSGFVVITSENSGVAALLMAGRELQRFELKATELKVAFHPMSQLMEESPWKEQLQDKLGLKKPVQFIVRVGYAKEQLQPGIRRDIKGFVEK